MLDKSFAGSGAQESSGLITPFQSRRERQKLVVRTKKGEVYCGMSFDMNRKVPEFHLDLQNVKGESLNRTIHIAFDDVKAVFYVKSFDGHFIPEDFQPWPLPEVQAIAVEFQDGEVLIGRPAHKTWNDEARFYIIPEKQDGNNMMVLIERSAVAAVHDAKSYVRRQHQEFEKYKAEHMKVGVPEDECKGDFYFSRHDYNNALRHYRIVHEKDPADTRVVRKMCAAKYNLGVRHIRNRDYEQALHFMHLVLKLDPAHPQAREKAAQLQAHIARRAH